MPARPFPILFPGFLCLMVLAGPSRGQDGPEREGDRRRRTIGKVVLRGGKAWEGARIAFVSWPYRLAPGIGTADRLEVRADRRGRFRTRLLSGRRYMAWAREEVSPGLFRVSEILDDVVAGIPLKFTEKRARIRVRRFRLEGRKVWKDYEPLGVEVLYGNERIPDRLPLALLEGDEVVVPPLPGTVVLQVLGKEGMPILSRRVDTRARGGSGTEDEVPRGGMEKEESPEALPLGRPVEVRIGVLKGKGGGNRKPSKMDGEAIAGARIELCVKTFAGSSGLPRLYPSGKTDEEGVARCRIPSTLSPIPLRVTAPGFSETYASFSLSLGEEERVGEGEEPDFIVTLKPGFVVKGRVLMGQGRGLAGLPLLVWASRPTGWSSWAHRRGPSFHLTTDAKGDFVLPSQDPRCTLFLAALLPDGILRTLEGDGPPLSPVAWLHFRTESKGGNLELGDLDLRKLSILRVRAVHSDGSPVVRPLFGFGETQVHPNGLIGVYNPAVFLGDGRGRLGFLCGESEGMILGARAEDGGYAQVALGKDAGEELPSRDGAKERALFLEMKKTLLVAGRVLDPRGKPLPEARVNVYFNFTGNGGEWRLYSFLGNQGGNIVRTDRNGRFRVGVPANVMVNLSASLQAGGRWFYSGATQIRAGEEEDPEPIELEIPLPKDSEVPGREDGKHK